MSWPADRIAAEDPCAPPGLLDAACAAPLLSALVNQAPIYSKTIIIRTSMVCHNSAKLHSQGMCNMDRPSVKMPALWVLRTVAARHWHAEWHGWGALARAMGRKARGGRFGTCAAHAASVEAAHPAPPTSLVPHLERPPEMGWHARLLSLRQTHD